MWESILINDLMFFLLTNGTRYILISLKRATCNQNTHKKIYQEKVK